MKHDGSASFGEDLAFLGSHTEIHLLEDPAGGARVAVAPAWQGRVMTSTTGGSAGDSHGWIHYENVQAGIRPPAQRQGLARHIHVFGGEERLWLGPEGGQFSIFFPPPPAPYTFENWRTPALIDTEAFEVISKDARRIVMQKDATLGNRAGARFDLRLVRSVELLDRAAISKSLAIELPEKPAPSLVGYRSANTLTNRGSVAWTREQGLLSIWMLGMLKHGPGVTMVVPLKAGPGNAVNADYFGPLAADRLGVTDQAVFFKGDGSYRSKIGVPPGRSTGLVASYDSERGRLTIVRCTLPPDAASLPYLRAQWEDHADPYAGDLINAYNDGSPAPGEAPLGPFYELETSSPALPLAPGEALSHIQETIHFSGTPSALDSIARSALGVSLQEISSAFQGR